ncbi:MAG: hypothetical protein D6766_12310 [Verrucomicrobia bacterium]|nr:MAG: hypothetical protein D6766_12310 [Verrucomicrobiota bacterium]
MAPATRAPSDLPETLARWWADPAHPVARERWPEERVLPFMPALERVAPETAARLRRTQALAGGLLRAPIVAVTGLLNAGKSSLVAAFLSPAGRKRVLRGIGSAAGTHRFVLWMPAAWAADEQLRSGLMALLSEVFGESPEPLAKDAAEALEQQRRRHDLGRPLVASDPALNEHGLCLLDCPDIQRRDELPAPGAAGEPGPGGARRRVLQAAGQLCAAVVVVTPRTQLEVRQVDEVLACLPEAARVLAVNFVRAEPPEVVLDEARRALPAFDGPVFVAYDAHHRDYARHTPRWDPNLGGAAAASADPLPCFFAVEAEGGANEPDRIGPERSILRLAGRLPPERCLQERQRRLLVELAAGCAEALRRLEERLEAEQRRCREVVRGLVSELRPLAGSGDQMRIKLDARVLGDLGEAIVRTAPWDVRPFLWGSHKSRRLLRSLREGAKAVGRLAGSLGPKWRQRVEQARAQMAEGLLTALMLAERLRLWSAGCGHHQPADYWLPVAEEVLRRFQSLETPAMSGADWDEVAAALWAETPKWKARATVAGSVLVALAAVGLVAFDGGLTLLTVGGLKGLGAGAVTVTAKELAGVLGFGVAAQSAASRRLERWLNERLARQQWADFVALAADAVGLPRGLLETGGGLEVLPTAPPTGAVKPFAAEVLRLVWIEPEPAGLREGHALLGDAGLKR